METTKIRFLDGCLASCYQKIIMSHRLYDLSLLFRGTMVFCLAIKSLYNPGNRLIQGLWSNSDYNGRTFARRANTFSKNVLQKLMWKIPHRKSRKTVQFVSVCLWELKQTWCWLDKITVGYRTQTLYIIQKYTFRLCCFVYGEVLWHPQSLVWSLPRGHCQLLSSSRRNLIYWLPLSSHQKGWIQKQAGAKFGEEQLT